ncbi:peptidyl-prolyl cis-trans isomerase-like 1 [Bacillus rossius redtenbacheri]|uniref:peptidyl-prolyl cis-trans isomerase-like 1 n=1 Tax=Bacillus rossius redtenbacheri TaxID=93214 RepID=UPI002FDE01D8
MRQNKSLIRCLFESWDLIIINYYIIFIIMSVVIPDKFWQPTHGVLETTMGEIVVELYWKHAPATCRNFAELLKRGYYNNTKFHRIIRDFMIQGGDPTGTGKGGASMYGRYFSDEIHEELKHTGAGILSMANSGPNTNGSQFFITLAPTQWLDGKHTIFGRVYSGLSVVKRIGLVETDKNDRPVDDVKIVRGYVKS